MKSALRSLGLVLAAASTLGGCGGGSGTSDGDPISDIVAQLELETDSVVHAAMARHGVPGFEPPAPGLTETYLRAPRRNAQVKRYFDGWARVESALTPTLHQTMTDIAARLEAAADLSRRDSMNLPVFVGSAIRNRLREIELRGQLADIVITAYDQDEVTQRTTLSPTLRAPRSGSTDSVSLHRRRLTPEQRRVIAEGEARAAAGSIEAQRSGAQVGRELAERAVTQYENRIDQINAEIQELLARRAAGHPAQ